MRLTVPLSKARIIPKEPVPFQEILPLKLKPTVSGKGGKQSDICCLYEMSLLFACFQKSDFNQNVCSKEVESFQNCYKSYMSTKKIKEDREAKGILTPGERKLSHKQLNILLKRYPNFK